MSGQRGGIIGYLRWRLGPRGRATYRAYADSRAQVARITQPPPVMRPPAPARERVRRSARQRTRGGTR
jgi:hypothetical protein